MSQFYAIWYDPQKCEAKAIKAGWDPNCGDGFLDIYFPEEDPKGHECKKFPTLDQAVTFLQKIIADGKDFWGQAKIQEYETAKRRCRYCTCHGEQHIRTYVIEPEGIVEDYFADDDCCD